MNQGLCEYCTRNGPERVPVSHEVSKPIYVCETCWKMLKEQKTALPLIRGNLSLRLRGKISKEAFKEMADRFFQEISTWKPRN